MNNEQKLQLINDIKNKIKGHYLIKDMIKEYDASDNFIDDIPMWFAEISTSARTDHGIIYFNYKLLEKPEELDHYALHEIKHCFQQCMNSKPTKGANDGDYLDNKYEQEGFQAQTEYLSDTRNDETAEKYIDKVLDHHDINNKKEREKRKKKLLHLASELK
jgi:hypothetical protein